MRSSPLLWTRSGPFPEVIPATGITDDMVKGGASQSEAVRQFLKFVNGRPLAAHNAGFDVGFIAEACRRMGSPLDATAVDTLPLAQALLPQLSKHKLDVVADHLGPPPSTTTGHRRRLHRGLYAGALL